MPLGGEAYGTRATEKASLHLKLGCGPSTCVFLNPLFGHLWFRYTPDSRGFRHFRGFRDFRGSNTQLLVCSCLSRFRDFRRFRDS